jgi:hypothetical protein
VAVRAGATRRARQESDARDRSALGAAEDQRGLGVREGRRRDVIGAHAHDGTRTADKLLRVSGTGLSPRSIAAEGNDQRESMRRRPPYGRGQAPAVGAGTVDSVVEVPEVLRRFALMHQDLWQERGGQSQARGAPSAKRSCERQCRRRRRVG